MKVMIRVDSSELMGIGHVMRCLTLATELRDRGDEVVFFTKRFPGSILEKIHNAGFSCRELVGFDSNGQRPNDYSSWLGEEAEAEAARMVSALAEVGEKFNVAVVDHYGIGLNYERTLRRIASKVFAIDDLADRPHDCDGLLDQTFNRSAAAYKALVPSRCDIMTGTKFALLRSEFRALRRQVKIDRAKRHGAAKILVSFGGTRTASLISRILEILDETPTCRGADVHAIVAPEDVKSLSSRCFQNISVLIEPLHDRIAQAMVNADVAIGACGTMSWERGALGLPTLGVILSNNQREIAEGLEVFGALRIVGSEGRLDEKKLSAELSILSTRGTVYEQMVQRSFDVCDADGAIRVADKVRGLVWKV